jgi:hypothetical protein
MLPYKGAGGGGPTAHGREGRPQFGHLVRERGRSGLDLTGSGLRSTQHSPLDLNLILNS